MAQRNIRIGIQAFMSGFKEAQSAIRGIKDRIANLRKSYVGVQQMSKRLGVSSRELAMSMKAQGYHTQQATMVSASLGSVMGKVGGTMKVVGKTIGGLVGGVRKLLNATKGFRPEWLSVMFISMMINRTLQGMIQPVMKMLGFFELWKLTLIELLTPVLMPLLEIFIDLLEWFMELEKPIKKAIGAFILLAFGLSKIMFVGSQFILLLSSVGIGLGSVMFLLSPFALALVTAAGSVKMFGDEADKMVGKFTGFVDGMVDKAIEMINTFASWFEENEEKIFEIANDIMSSLIGGLERIITSDALSDIVYRFLDMLSKLFDENKDSIKNIIKTLIGWMVDFFVEFAPEILELGSTVVQGLAEGIKQALDNDDVRESIEEIIDVIGELLEELSPYLGELLLKGIMSGLSGLWGAIMKRIKEEPITAVSKAVGVGVGGLIGGYLGGPIGAAYGAAGGALLAPDQQEMIRYGLMSARPILGSYQTGGNIGQTGLYQLHAGEEVIPKNRNRGEIIINNEYNINVSDKREFERMLDQNNRRLTADIRRQIKT